MVDISNVVSAQTQGTEDFSGVAGSGQISVVTSPLPSADWGRVFQFTGNATQGALTFARESLNIAAPIADHIIYSFYLRFTDLSPTEFEFLGNNGFGLILEADGDIRAEDSANSTIVTATNPLTVDTWHRFEVRILPSAGSGELQVWVDYK